MKAGPIKQMTIFEWIATEGPIGDGWVAAAFYVAQDGKKLDVRGQCFGWKKNSFGIYESNANTTLGELRLSIIVHIATGTPLAIFDKPDSAAIGGDILEGLATWGAFKPAIANLKKWRDVFPKIDQAWRNNKIIVAPALTMGGQSIWMLKPEAEAAPDAIDRLLYFKWEWDAFTPMGPTGTGAMRADMSLGRLLIRRHGRPPDPALPWEGTFSNRRVGFYAGRDEGKKALEEFYMKLPTQRHKRLN